MLIKTTTKSQIVHLQILNKKQNKNIINQLNNITLTSIKEMKRNLNKQMKLGMYYSVRITLLFQSFLTVYINFKNLTIKYIIQIQLKTITINQFLSQLTDNFGFIQKLHQIQLVYIYLKNNNIYAFNTQSHLFQVLSDKHKKQQYDSARSYSNNTNETSQRNANEHGQQYNYEEFIRKQGPNGFYQQYSYRSNHLKFIQGSSNSQQFSKEQMEEMQKQAQEFMNMFQNGQFSQFSQAFRQATKGDPKFNRVHTFMNFAEMAGKFYQDRQRQQVENEIKRQQNVQSFANKEEKLKESFQNIKSGIKGLWDQFTKK